MSDARRAVRAWCLYDWANSAFATTVMAAMYPPFFRSLAVAAGLPEHRATTAWAFTSAAALLVVVVAGPFLGALADHTGRRKTLLAACVALGVAATAAFPLNGQDTWLLAAGLFVVASIGFSGGNVFYESLLPSVAAPAELDRVSSWGYALGYLGGGLLLVVNAAWVMRPALFGLADANAAVRLSFLSVALWWALFSLPILRHVPAPPAARRDPAVSAATAAFGRLLATARELRRYRQLMLFLAAFWLYNDGINTIIRMATAYGDEIGIGLGDLVGALVVTQFVGFPCAIGFARVAARVGAKRAILGALAVYTAISVGGYFMTTASHFYLLAAAVGTVQGGAQALSRSLFATMVPAHKAAEMFAFYGVSGKLAGLLGPLVFGVVAELAGGSRLAILSLIVFFVAGASLLTLVDVEEGARAAQEL